MTITLSDGTDTLDLHADLYWADEHNWSPVEQTAQRTITGALIVSVATRIAGRPITLQPPDDSGAWTAQSTLDQLRHWAAGAGTVLQLTLRGQTRDVMFRHHDGSAIEATPIKHLSDAQPGDWHLVTVRLMEI